MTEKNPRHLTVSKTMHVPFSIETIWPALCPTREYDWIEFWDCELVHSRSGCNELGCVFRTEFPAEGDRETWLTTRFDPFTRIEFVRTNSNRVIHFIIELIPDEKHGTTLVWTHHVTALNAEGLEYIANKKAAFATQMAMLHRMLTHYLETGTMLKIDTPDQTETIAHHAHHRTTG